MFPRVRVEGVNPVLFLLYEVGECLAAFGLAADGNREPVPPVQSAFSFALPALPRRLPVLGIDFIRGHSGLVTVTCEMEFLVASYVAPAADTLTTVATTEGMVLLRTALPALQ